MKYPSPSLVISLTALVVALGGAGIAATGGNFILGQNNSATTQSQLTAPINSEALRLSNTSSAANATGLLLVTNTARPPMRVSSTVRVAKLNADMVDGKHAADFASATSEGWHYIGDTGEPAFQNSWDNYDSTGVHNDATWRHAAYRIDQNGVVHLGGLISGGTAPSVAFTLQGQYCPWFYHPYPIVSNNAFGRITVSFIAAGDCDVIVEIGAPQWVSLDGISYQTFALEQQIAPPPSVSALHGRPISKRGNMPRR